MTYEILIMLMTGFALTIIVAIATVSVKIKKIQKRIDAFESALNRNLENTRALFAGATGVGDHLTRVEQLMRRTSASGNPGRWPHRRRCNAKCALHSQCAIKIARARPSCPPRNQG